MLFLDPLPLRPRHLRSGDRVAIVTLVAPDAARFPDQFRRGLAFLSQLGLDPVVMPRACDHTYGHLAADPAVLASDVHEAFSDPSISAVFIAGGGTNANRILPCLDYGLIRETPKVLIGPGDAASVLNAIYRRSGVLTFCGPSIVHDFGSINGLTGKALRSLQTLLCQHSANIDLLCKTSKAQFLKPGSGTGRLVGGNLSALARLVGTHNSPDWWGTLLFCDDTAAEAAELDATLTHFRQAGVFEQIAGLVLGRRLTAGFDTSPDTCEVFEHTLAGCSFPILGGVSLNHGGDHVTLPIGAMATINSEKGSFSLDEPVTMQDG